MNHFSKMNIFFRLAAISLFLFLSWTLPPASIGAEQPAPGAVLDRLSKSFSREKGFESRFSQSLTPPNSRAVFSDGDLLYKSPGKMILRYRNPKGQILLLSGNEVSLYVPQNKQILLRTLNSTHHIPETPALLFANLGHLDRYFFVRPEGSGTLSDQTSYAIELIPRQPDPHLAVARISIDLKSGFPRSITFMESSGMEISIRLIDLHPRASVQDSDFDLRVPAQTTVVRVKGGF